MAGLGQLKTSSRQAGCLLPFSLALSSAEPRSPPPPFRLRPWSHSSDIDIIVLGSSPPAPSLSRIFFFGPGPIVGCHGCQFAVKHFPVLAPGRGIWNSMLRPGSRCQARWDWRIPLAFAKLSIGVSFHGPELVLRAGNHWQLGQIGGASSCAPPRTQRLLQSLLCRQEHCPAFSARQLAHF